MHSSLCYLVHMVSEYQGCALAVNQAWVMDTMYVKMKHSMQNTEAYTIISVIPLTKIQVVKCFDLKLFAASGYSCPIHFHNSGCNFIVYILG